MAIEVHLYSSIKNINVVSMFPKTLRRQCVILHLPPATWIFMI